MLQKHLYGVPEIGTFSPLPISYPPEFTMTTKDLLSSCYLPIYSLIEKKPLKTKNQEKFKQYLLLKFMSVLYDGYSQLWEKENR